MKFVAFDLETTGLDLKVDKILEVAAVKFSLDSDNYGTFSSLCACSITIPEEATRVNSIRNEDLVDAPHPGLVINAFRAFCGMNILVAHNAPFDMAFLSAACVGLRTAKITNPVIDSLRVARKLYPEKSHKLGDMARGLGIQVDSDRLHRGLYDCEVLMHLFKRMMKKIKHGRDMNSFLKSMEKIAPTKVMR